MKLWRWIWKKFRPEPKPDEKKRSTYIDDEFKKMWDYVWNEIIREYRSEN